MYLYIYIYIHIYKYIYTIIYTYSYTRTFIYTYMSMHTCIHTHIHLYYADFRLHVISLINHLELTMSMETLFPIWVRFAILFKCQVYSFLFKRQHALVMS